MCRSAAARALLASCNGTGSRAVADGHVDALGASALLATAGVKRHDTMELGFEKMWRMIKLAGQKLICFGEFSVR